MMIASRNTPITVFALMGSESMLVEISGKLLLNHPNKGTKVATTKVAARERQTRFGQSMASGFFYRSLGLIPHKKHSFKWKQYCLISAIMAHFSYSSGTLLLLVVVSSGGFGEFGVDVCDPGLARLFSPVILRKILVGP